MIRMFPESCDWLSAADQGFSNPSCGLRITCVHLFAASSLLNAQGLQRPVIVFQDVPSHALPEASPLNVCIQNKGVTLCDSLPSESAQASVDQCSADPAMPVRLADGKMAQDASPTFVAAEYCANDPISVASDEAKASIAS
jgi:hypothetical protein